MRSTLVDELRLTVERLSSALERACGQRDRHRMEKKEMTLLLRHTRPVATLLPVEPPAAVASPVFYEHGAVTIGWRDAVASMYARGVPMNASMDVIKAVVTQGMGCAWPERVPHGPSLTLRAVVERACVERRALALELGTQPVRWLGWSWDGTVRWFGRAFLTCSIFFRDAAAAVRRAHATLTELYAGKGAAAVAAVCTDWFAAMAALQAELAIPEDDRVRVSMISELTSDHEATNTGRISGVVERINAARLDEVTTGAKREQKAHISDGVWARRKADYSDAEFLGCGAHVVNLIGVAFSRRLRRREDDRADGVERPVLPKQADSESFAHRMTRLDHQVECQHALSHRIIPHCWCTGVQRFAAMALVPHQPW
jgi:hypothetical protein